MNHRVACVNLPIFSCKMTSILIDLASFQVLGRPESQAHQMRTLNLQPVKPCIILAAGLLVGRCHSANFVVTNNLDSGPGSLRSAVSNSNVSGGTVTFSNVTGTIVLTNGQLTISQPGVNIIGPGAANLIISGYQSNGVFMSRLPLPARFRDSPSRTDRPRDRAAAFALSAILS